LLAHPRFLTRPDITDAEKEKRQSLFPDWANAFRDEWGKRKELERAKQPDNRREGRSPSAVYGSAEQVAVNDDGILQISWPALADRSGQLETFDLLLATATTPTFDPQTGDYPSVEVVANAWKKNEEQFRYFRRNQENQITTYQDERIETLLPDLTEKPMSLTRRERLRRVVLLCCHFARNLAYSRVGGLAGWRGRSPTLDALQREMPNMGKRVKPIQEQTGLCG
jgi:hypothetical protein